MRTLVALWKANVPHWVWIISPAWVGAVLLALDGASPNWGTLLLFASTILTIQFIAEFANSYTDREEDAIYGPTNTLVTGELSPDTARKVFLAQNMLAGILLIALLVVTLNYLLIAIMLAGWFFGLAYSLQPFRLKETIHSPFSHGIALALLPLAGWLIIAPLNDFIIAFSAFLFLHSYGLGITLKFRKTLLALDSGLVKLEEGRSLYEIRTIGFGMKFRNAMHIEAMTSLGGFVLVPIFWHLGVFAAPLSIALLAVPLPLTALAVLVRYQHPVKNSSVYKILMTVAWISIVLVFLGSALTSFVYYSVAVLICLLFLFGFPLMVKLVHPWGSKSLGGRY